MDIPYQSQARQPPEQTAGRTAVVVWGALWLAVGLVILLLFLLAVTDGRSSAGYSGRQVEYWVGTLFSIPVGLFFFGLTAWGALGLIRLRRWSVKLMAAWSGVFLVAVVASIPPFVLNTVISGGSALQLLAVLLMLLLFGGFVGWSFWGLTRPSAQLAVESYDGTENWTTRLPLPVLMVFLFAMGLLLQYPAELLVMVVMFMKMSGMFLWLLVAIPLLACCIALSVLVINRCLALDRSAWETMLWLVVLDAAVRMVTRVLTPGASLTFVLEDPKDRSHILSDLAQHGWSLILMVILLHLIRPTFDGLSGKNAPRTV